MIPEQTKETIDAYVESGRPTGGFVKAVLSNDLQEAFGRADAENTAAMKGIVIYLYNDCPADCWGSPERYLTWIKQGGLKGLKKKTSEGV